MNEFDEFDELEFDTEEMELDTYEVSADLAEWRFTRLGLGYFDEE